MQLQYHQRGFTQCVRMYGNKSVRHPPFEGGGDLKSGQWVHYVRILKIVLLEVDSDNCTRYNMLWDVEYRCRLEKRNSNLIRNNSKSIDAFVFISSDGQWVSFILVIGRRHYSCNITVWEIKNHVFSLLSNVFFLLPHFDWCSSSRYRISISIFRMNTYKGSIWD